MDFSFAGMRVLVTASAAGAGRAIAESFADRGAEVFACDIDAAAVAALAAARADITVLTADIGDEGAIDGLFAAIDSAGGIDVLVNNAGVAGPTAPAEEIAASDWNRTLAVNLTGAFLCARAAIPGMKQRGRGAIINISSASAKVGLPMRLPYVVSKAALLSLTQNLARELGAFGIRVNAILPGPIEGERLRRIIAAKSAALGIAEADYETALKRYVSMKTMVAPQDIAAMALFLASDAARYVSGQCIGVDGNLEYEE